MPSAPTSHPHPPSSGAERVALASALTLPHLLAIARLPLPGYGFDSGQYLSMMPAGFSDLHPPGYALFLTLVQAVSSSASAPVVANHLLTILTALCLYKIARRAMGVRWAILGAALYPVLTRALVWDSWLLSESLFLCLLALLLWGASHGPIDTGTKRRALAQGALLGAAVLVRSAAWFVLPALLCHGAWRAWRDGAARKRAAARAALLIAGALAITLPAKAAHWHQHGSTSITQAMAWNLLYGHPNAARCTPAPTQTPIHQRFCERMSEAPARWREFKLHQHPRSPGALLIKEYGSFKAAGPPLKAIMLTEIRARPLAYLSDSWDNMSRWLDASEAWYLPKRGGQLVHDRKVSARFAQKFPGQPLPVMTRSAWVDVMMFHMSLPRATWLLVWLLLMAWPLTQRRLPHALHLAVLSFLAGTVLIAFGEPRYFAPVALLICALIPLELARHHAHTRTLRQPS